MGDTLPSIATTFSMTDRNFYLWDKGQLIVIISRTRLAIDTIFVGDKESTLNALVAILKCRTQWTDHMENILKVVTINIDDDNVEIEENRGTMSHANFPYRPNDIRLPSDCSGYEVRPGLNLQGFPTDYHRTRGVENPAGLALVAPRMYIC